MTTREDLVTTYRVLRALALNPKNTSDDVRAALAAARGIAATIMDMDYPV